MTMIQIPIERREEAIPEGYVKVVRCKDCCWWQHKNDEIQGLCRQSGTHPTGEWYCANGMTEKQFEEYVNEVERRTIAETIELFTYRKENEK